MKMMRKIGALVLAIMMIAMVSAAYADAGNNYSGATQTTVSENSIPLTKTIVMINKNGSNVYEPNISFSYAVAPDTSVPAYGTSPRTPDTTVTDSATPANVGRVYPGPAGGVTGGITIAFSSDHDAVPTSSTGVEVTKTGNLTFNPAATWVRPGIYRYIITESVAGTGTTDADKIAAAGLTARGSTYSNTRYLDVYVKYNQDGTGFVMYGAVIYKALSTDTSAESKSITSSTEGKTTGFEPNSAGTGTVDYTADGSVDRYTTYDIAVKKTVSGSMADKNHEFPFYVSISNSINGAKYTYIDDPGTGTGTAESLTGTATSITKGTDATTSSLALKDGEYVKFVGLPSNQTTNLAIVVKEFNDTIDAYTPSVTATYGSPTLTSTNAATGSQMAASTGSDTTASFDIVSNDYAAQILTINNNLSEISPTGYVTRFAPYALILIGGISLLIIAMKRRNHKEDD